MCAFGEKLIKAGISKALSVRLARQLFTEESMEAMIKYYEGETLGLGGKTAGSPGVGLQAHAPAGTPVLGVL